MDGGKDVREGFTHVGSSHFCVCVSIQKVCSEVDVWVQFCVVIKTPLGDSDLLSSPPSYVFFPTVSFQRLPNGPSSGLEDSELERQREGEIERQRAELSQLRERLALMCRQVRVFLFTCHDERWISVRACLCVNKCPGMSHK